MREIKFRGFHVFAGNALYPEKKIWVYGSLLIENGEYWIKDGNMTYCVVPDSVGQLTEHEDNKGKKVYEGDIIHHLLWHDEYEIREVKWDKEIAGFRPFAEWFDLPDLEGYSEIIGNVHENPELMEPNEDDAVDNAVHQHMRDMEGEG